MNDPTPDPERDDATPDSWGREMVTVPTGWPAAVLPPGHERFEETARTWLYDQAPGPWRDYEVLHRHPLMLARNLRYLALAELEGLRAAYSRARVELADHFEPSPIDTPAPGVQGRGRTH